MDKDSAHAGYRVYRCDINERRQDPAFLGARQGREPSWNVVGVAGGSQKNAEAYEREVRDLPWLEYLKKVEIELFRWADRRAGSRRRKYLLLPSE